MRGRRAVRIAAAMLLLGAALVVVPETGATAASALPPFRCGTVSGGAHTFAHITDVRVARHVGYDRFMIQFSGSRVPHYLAIPKTSTVFWLDPSNKRVQLLGVAGIKVVLNSASGIGTYHGPRDIRTGIRQLREARQIGDFEAVTTWGLGLARQSCKRVFALTGPPRLVIDVPN